MRTSTITYNDINNNIVTNRLVTQIGNLYVAKGRNPYGSHNLVLIMEVDGELRTIRYGNATTLTWVASENCADRKIKRALVRCFEAIGVNPLANKPMNRLQELVSSNKTRYIAKLEAERLGRE